MKNENWHAIVTQVAEKARINPALAIEQLDSFVRQKGIILGQRGPAELGRLLRAPSKPLCAFLRGDPALLFHRPAVGIVGSRKPTPKGAKRARDFARDLAKAGVLVVSGGAMGIDLAAHEGALEGGGPTLAVLGEVLNPKGDERPHRLKRLGAGLTAVTMFGPWVKPGPGLFVSRNQYVAALSDMVVVIEGGEKSGALHTANYAKRIGVPILAVPGDIDDPLAAAPNWLLEQGMARAVTRVEGVLGALSIKVEAKVTSPLPILTSQNLPLPLAGEGNNVVKAFNTRKSMAFDELVEILQMPAAQVQLAVFELELAGVLGKNGAELVLLSG